MSEDKPVSLKSVTLSDRSISDKSEPETNVSLLSTKTKFLCCCISHKWCFKHQGLSAYKFYDENDVLCFKCLDCCSWCLEFKQKKNCLCKNKTICFMCCFSITFV